jgi:PKHD-type hydroxylase
MLLHVPNILDREQVARFRQALDQASWTDARETVAPQGAKVKRNLQLPDASPLREEFGRKVLDALARHPLYHAATLPQRTLMPRFNRYEGGGQYGFHVDGAVMALPHGEQLRSDTYGEHEVKLPAGDIIIYPSSSLHSVMPVTRGARIAAFFWVQSLVRDDSKRRLLFEFDAAIQRLVATGADNDAVLQLTGTYHNLLRQWAES